MSVFTRNAIHGKTGSSEMNTNQSHQLKPNGDNLQHQYSRQNGEAETPLETGQSWDCTETEALILSCSEETDFEIFLEEITEIAEQEITGDTSADEEFDWEVFLTNYLSTEPSNESQDLSLTPQFSSTKVEDFYEERVEMPEEILDVLGDWIDWCYDMERRMLELEYSIIRHLTSDRRQLKILLEEFSGNCSISS